MALPASDNFNRADANPIGGNWTTITGLFDFKILSNALVNTSGGGVNGTRWNADTFNNDQYSQIAVISLGDGGPAVRVSSSVQTYYFFDVRSAGADAGIYKVVAGTLTLIGSSWNPAVVSGDTLKLEVIGTSLKAYKNGTQTGSTQTDSAIASGSAGVENYSTGTYDDWTGGNTGGGFTAVRRRTLGQKIGSRQ